MDTFTHVMLGASATAPFWASHPLESVAFVFGSVLPDTDALSRQFGKVAYLRAHQTWTHAIPLQLAVSAAGAAAMVLTDMAFLAPSFVALGLGMVLHSLLDWTNTYGVTLFAPFDRRRRYLEWVFFIDAYVIAITAVALGGQGLLFSTTGTASPALAGGWFVLLSSYFAVKGWLRRRAATVLPTAISLVPSALWPTRFYALTIDEGWAETSTVDAWRRAVSRRERRALFPTEVGELAELRVMRDLSVGFAATAHDGERVVFEDLRTRNFGTNFGRLTLDLRGDTVVVEAFDV